MSLTTADVHALSLGNAGAELLAKAIEANKTLRTLVIRDNDITADGGRSFARALKANTTLKEIRMGGNR